MPISQVPKSTISIGIALVSLLLFDGVQGQYTVNSTTSLDNTDNRTGFPPCDAIIAANLSHALHMPTAPDYTSLVDAYWSSDTRKAPYCFVLPSSPSELSKVITALSPSWAGDGAGDWHIAIRSGGHSGGNSNNIADGVVIDLSLLNTTTYDAATNIAHIGTGAHWQDVYETLHQDSVSVLGGRQGVVGVGGFLLGGGIGWSTPRKGFGCDSVVNFEVALTNGDIINANASANSDLYRALKGGGSNFGIVTRFDMEAFPATNVTYGSTVIGMDHIDEVISAIAGFADLDQSFDDNAMLVDITYSAQAGKTSILVLQVNTVNDANTTAFDAINAIPALTGPTKQSVSVPQSADTDEVSSSAVNTQNAGSSLTLVNDPRIIRFAVEQHDKLVADLNATLGPKNFGTIQEFQPIPGYVGELGAKRGGNMLGLERSTSNKLFLVFSALLQGEKAVTEVPRVAQQISVMTEKIQEYSKSIGLWEDFLYMNYAKTNQDSLGSYGAANIAFMKQVAKKYDPHGFLQSRVPGGFKISRVD